MRRQRYASDATRDPFLAPDTDDSWLERWTVEIASEKQWPYRLFGCTEDGRCVGNAKLCRPMCEHCLLPVCRECFVGVGTFFQQANVPMLLSNDHYYGYVDALLASGQVTWLECACASLCWSTLLVYYLEESYGHLMLESMEGPQSRTQVRGNLFSFSLPWEDVERCCRAAVEKKMNRSS